MGSNHLFTGRNKEKKMKSMVIDGETYVLQTGGEKIGPYFIGTKMLIRTVTMTLTGLLVEVYERELVLTSAAWIADTGCYHDALTTGTLVGVEPYPDGRVIVGRGALVDACEWVHALPRGVS